MRAVRGGSRPTDGPPQWHHAAARGPVRRPGDGAVRHRQCGDGLRNVQRHEKRPHARGDLGHLPHDRDAPRPGGLWALPAALSGQREPQEPIIIPGRHSPQARWDGGLQDPQPLQRRVCQHRLQAMPLLRQGFGPSQAPQRPGPPRQLAARVHGGECRELLRHVQHGQREAVGGLLPRAVPACRHSGSRRAAGGAACRAAGGAAGRAAGGAVSRAAGRAAGRAAS
mmetsp:Transcript_110863/g.346886  ORF Transcript_110863/g.346886 Transcript_110863/m.346886 type:complete len:225 (+) Transcript_110863:756-1430(+)